jgi:hypothetical protein
MTTVTPHDGGAVEPSHPLDPRIRVITAILALVILAVVVGGLITHTSKVEPLAPQSVLYSVDGSAASASMTLTTPTGALQFDASLPLTDEDGRTGLTFVFPAGSLVSLVATSDGRGTVTCHIAVDGVETSTATASGNGNSADCEGAT